MSDDWDEIEDAWEGSTRKSALHLEAHRRAQAAAWAERERRMRWAAVIGYALGALVILAAGICVAAMSVTMGLEWWASLPLGMVVGFPSGFAACWTYTHAREALEVRAILST